MKKRYLILLLLFMSVQLIGQTNDVFIFLTEAGGPPVTLSGATVNMTGPGGYDETLITGNPVGDVFENVPYGAYNYSISKDCFTTITGMVTVDANGGMGISVFESLAAETTNNVFFFVGSPLPLSGVEVNMTGPGGYDETLITGNPIGDLFENVPFGTYNYTMTKDCYVTKTGTVTVECLGGGMGVSVFDTPAAETTNNVFFFVGSPLPLSGVEVNMTGPGGYDETLITGNPIGDLFENVPFGTYNYTMTKDCYVTKTGTVTVECLGGGMGVSVFDTPAAETTNNVFFFVGSPLPLSGVEVNMTGPGGYDETLITGNPIGDLFENVPFGTYNYTMTKDCYVTTSGTVTVECLGGGMGVSVFDTPAAETTNNVFFFVGSPLPLSGVEVNMTGPNGYDETLITGNPIGDLFENVPFGEYSYTMTKDCYVTTSGTVTVECLGGGMGVSVFDTPAAETTNNVFFFVGSPLPLSGVEVNMTGPNGYDETLITGNPIGDLFENVPFGEYSYTMTKDCYVTTSGTVTVECLGGGMGVSVFDTPAAETTNNVFFFVGSPLPISGATVNMTGPNGYDETLVTGNPVGDLFENVPFGVYDYTISNDCYETVTGSVTVECIGGGMGVSVFENPAEETTNNVFFFVGSPLPISGATVNMTGPNGYDETLVTGNPVGDLFENVPFGVYDYTITNDCYETVTGSVTVECIGGGMGVSVFENPAEETTNNVFFFVGSPLPISGATVNMTGPNGYDETLVTGNPVGDLFENVPFGVYDYTITNDCYETVTGSVTVECIGGGMGVSVFENPAEETTNNVFFFVGSPLPISGATVNMTGPNGYDETLVTGNPVGDLFENVPFGVYDYTITNDCYETVTGSVTVECIGGGMGVSVFENPAEETTNNVFFFVGSPLPISGATVNMTGPNGYDETLITGNPVGDLFENVPFGVYDYTITNDCYETVTGSVTVECIGGGMGVSVFENPAEETTNNVFFFVGSPLPISGATVNMTGPNGYDETLITGNPVGDLFENVPFGVYDYTISNDCYETVTGSVTVECIGGGMGVSVFENPAEETTNNVFFFVGSPLPISGATVNMTGPNGYDETLVTGNPVGDLFENVPFGVYDYTISNDCYETITGSVTVECLGGGMGVSVFENPAEIVLDLSVTVTSTTLTANATGVTYQWIDCDTNTAIPGAINQVFEPTESGNYAVEITDGNCVGLSDCFNITILGTTGFEINNSISLYPNPAIDHITIDLDVIRTSVSVQIANMAGKVILNKTIAQSDRLELDVTDLSTGVYVVIVNYDNGIFTKKIVKE